MVIMQNLLSLPFFKKKKFSFNAINATCIGASHLKENKPCQDFSACILRPDYSIVAVADGHGGEKHFRSDKGARFAVDAAITCIENLILTNDILISIQENSIINFENIITTLWRKLILEDIKQDPYKDKQIVEDYFTPYGTTLIAAALTKNYWFAVQIGDGKCVVINTDKSISQPIPWDERCFLNQTTSLCDKDTSKNFRHFYSEEKPLAIFLGTDGIDNTFPINNNEEHLAAFYQRVYENFKKEGIKRGKKQLKKMLPLFSKKGSSDDVSIAGIIKL